MLSRIKMTMLAIYSQYLVEETVWFTHRLEGACGKSAQGKQQEHHMQARCVQCDLLIIIQWVISLLSCLITYSTADGVLQ